MRNITIPDGAGGVIFPGSDNNAANWIYRTGGSKIAPPLAPDEMLLGENSTLYIARDQFFGGGYAAMSLDTGAVIWQKTGGMKLVSVLADGTLLVASTSGSNLRKVALDGQETLAMGDIGVQSAQFVAPGTWNGVLPNGSFGLATDAALPADDRTWGEPGGGPARGNVELARCACLLQSGTDQQNAEVMESASNAPENFSNPQSPTYVLVTGDQGKGTNNVGALFNLAAETHSSLLVAEGGVVIVPNTTPPKSYFRASSVEQINQALTIHGPITGGFTFFGHGGWLSSTGASYSAVFVGEDAPTTTNPNPNLYAQNVNLISGTQLGTEAIVTINACNSGKGGRNSIAQLIANQLNRKVKAYPVGMFFSKNPNRRSSVGPKENLNNGPIYMLPEQGASAITFCPGGRCTP